MQTNRLELQLLNYTPVCTVKFSKNHFRGFALFIFVPLVHPLEFWCFLMGFFDLCAVSKRYRWTKLGMKLENVDTRYNWPNLPFQFSNFPLFYVLIKIGVNSTIFGANIFWHLASYFCLLFSVLEKHSNINITKPLMSKCRLRVNNFALLFNMFQFKNFKVR